MNDLHLSREQFLHLSELWIECNCQVHDALWSRVLSKEELPEEDFCNSPIEMVRSIRGWRAYMNKYFEAEDHQIPESFSYLR